jgi:ATP-dependent DNA ligase
MPEWHLAVPSRWRTLRLRAAAERIKAKSFTIDGEAVVVRPDGLSRCEELRRREAAHTAILYAFDLIEHDGEDLRNLPFLDRKAVLARLLRNIEAGIVLNEHVAEDGYTVFQTPLPLTVRPTRVTSRAWLFLLQVVASPELRTAT